MTYPIEFEWDEAKNRANQRKHGFSFTDARLVIENSGVVGLSDVDRHVGEERFLAVGEVKGRLAVVVFSEPDENTIRIISMRAADRREKKMYQDYLEGFQ